MIWTYDCCTTGIVSYTHDSPQPMWHSSPALTWSSWPVCCCWASPAWTRPCHGWWWERSPSDTASCFPWRRSWEAWSPAGTDSECGADRDHTQVSRECGSYRDVRQRDGHLLALPHLQLSFTGRVDGRRLKIIWGRKHRLGNTGVCFKELLQEYYNPCILFLLVKLTILGFIMEYCSVYSK